MMPLVVPPCPRSRRNDRHQVVGHERLVVHAPDDGPEMRHEVHEAHRPRRKRIEQADLDVGVMGNGDESRVTPTRVHVVQQQTHADTAVGGL